MRKILRIICLGATLLAFSSPALANSVYRVFLPASLPIQSELLLQDMLQDMLQDSAVSVVTHKADNAELDIRALEQAVSLPSDGVVVVTDNQSWSDPEAEVLISKYRAERPVYSLGSLHEVDNIDAQLGANIEHFIDITQGALQETTGDTMCIYDVESKWCDELLSRWNNGQWQGALTVRSISIDQPVSMQMALNVAAMTENPNIKRIIISDIGILNNLQRALTVIGGDYYIGNIGYDAQTEKSLAEGAIDFAIDPQLALQARLILAAMNSYRQNGQRLKGIIPILPLVRK